MHVCNAERLDIDLLRFISFLVCLVDLMGQEILHR